MAPSWNDPALVDVASDSTRTATYRRLQSWYRETVLQARPGSYKPAGRPERQLGSLLHSGDADAGKNFLDPLIRQYADERASLVTDTIEKGRLFHNMLSSMPLCFNLFGMVRSTPSEKLLFVQQLFDDRAEFVELIECEWKSTHDGATINDRTAFDAAIITRRPDGTRHLIGIETKYTEPFSQTAYGAIGRRDAGRYREIHDSCGWFDPAAHDALTNPRTNQLWRNCLLAAATERSGAVDSAEVAVVALADDLGARVATDGVTAAMPGEPRCGFVSLESVVETSKTLPELADWAVEFERRYLNISPVQF